MGSNVFNVHINLCHYSGARLDKIITHTPTVEETSFAKQFANNQGRLKNNIREDRAYLGVLSELVYFSKIDTNATQINSTQFDGARQNGQTVEIKTQSIYNEFNENLFCFYNDTSWHQTPDLLVFCFFEIDFNRLVFSGYISTYDYLRMSSITKKGTTLMPQNLTIKHDTLTLRAYKLKSMGDLRS